MRQPQHFANRLEGEMKKGDKRGKLKQTGEKEPIQRDIKM